MAHRHSAAVYRRRRLVALIGIIVVLLGLGVGAWVVIAQPWASASPTPVPIVAPPAEGAETADPSQEPSAEPTEPAAEETPGIAPCQASAITVEAITSDAYAAGENPQFSIALTNAGVDDCTINVGTNTQQFTVKSGEDIWWRSTDCQQEPSAMVVTLTAGQTVTSKEPVVWDRTRSTPETCESTDRPRAAGGGASYHLTVSIGGFDSAVTKQFMLM